MLINARWGPYRCFVGNDCTQTRGSVVLISESTTEKKFTQKGGFKNKISNYKVSVNRFSKNGERAGPLFFERYVAVGRSARPAAHEPGRKKTITRKLRRLAHRTRVPASPETPWFAQSIQPRFSGRSAPAGILPLHGGGR